MQTIVYFVRHAKSDSSVHEDNIRPLTAEGLADTKLVTRFLKDKSIDYIFSSPYKRAADTVLDFSKEVNLPIICIEDFKERRVDNVWIEDFVGFARNQWADFNYKLSSGESLHDVQSRNIGALNELLAKYRGKNIAIGTHGTALSTIIHFYDNSFGFDQFFAIIDLMPWVVRITFEDTHCVSMESFNLFDLYR